MVQAPHPQLGTLQIELSTRCTLHCRTCIRAYFPSQWCEKDMADSTLSAILSAAPAFSKVRLQGWGEPLTRSDLPDIIREFKKRGVSVSLSSTGMHLTPHAATELIRAGLDSITFTLAGHTEHIQHNLRGDGTFAPACSAIQAFANARQSAATPSIHIRFLLTQHTAPHLDKAVRLAAALGADSLVPAHIVHVSSPEQKALVAYDQRPRHVWPMLKARISAIRHRVGFTSPPMRTENIPVCTMTPTRNAFVAADGAVSPCENLCPPMTGEYPIHLNGNSATTTRLSFGTISPETPLKDIWNSQDYAGFRASFERRASLFDALTKNIGTDYDSSARLEEAARTLEKAFSTTHKPPQPCRYCPQHRGI